MNRLLCIPTGPLAENCYIVWNPETRHALLFDPGDDFPKIRRALAQNELSLDGVLLTHAHFDHIGALPAMAAEYGAALKIWCPTADRALYSSPRNGMAPWYPPVQGLPELPAATDDPPFAEFGFETIATPGHTPGGTSYYFPQEGFVLTGDTLFAGSVGRTDFEGGSEAELMHSIQERLFALPNTTIVYPGHGPKTSIGTEKLGW